MPLTVGVQNSTVLTVIWEKDQVENENSGLFDRKACRWIFPSGGGLCTSSNTARVFVRPPPPKSVHYVRMYYGLINVNKNVSEVETWSVRGIKGIPFRAIYVFPLCPHIYYIIRIDGIRYGQTTDNNLCGWTDVLKNQYKLRWFGRWPRMKSRPRLPGPGLFSKGNTPPEAQCKSAPSNLVRLQQFCDWCQRHRFCMVFVRVGLAASRKIITREQYK